MPTKLQSLQDHCNLFEDELVRCASLQEAEQLKERICNRLQESCQSEMLRGLLDEHATSIIAKRFSPSSWRAEQEGG